MNNLSKDQFNLLVEKGIIHKNGFVQLYNDKGADYKILDIIPEESKYMFSVKNIDTRVTKMISQNLVEIVEDMPIDRIMEAYMVDDELNTHDIIRKTDVLNNVIGKKAAKVAGIQLEDGIKLVLYKDVTDKYNNKVLTVSGVGSSIKLSAPRGRPKKNT